jgi:putative hemolysin
MRHPEPSKLPKSQATPISLGARETVPPLDEMRGSYQVRFARTAADVEACCRLRYEIFNLELGEGLVESEATGIDQDKFDEVCDHLMVIDTTTGEVAGTYRMQTYAMAVAGHGFYSAGEYDLSTIPQAEMRQALELGRAAIASDHRDRSVLFLLWRGLMAYHRWNDARFFFGCSSLTSQDPREGLRCQDYLERKGYYHNDIFVAPLQGYVCEADDHKTFTGTFPVPKLFGFYLRFAAKVLSAPALDRYFGTIDFLIWTDTRSIVGRLAESFAKNLPRRS